VTYDGHDGTDFRVMSLDAAAKGVAVLASAPGKVKAVRDGVEDRLATAPGDTAGRECGNGVVIDHGEGWETQYCHMKRASVTARVGDSVAAGAPLGQVGYSGRAQFAHVHLTVRRNGKKIDPFSGKDLDGACALEDTALASSLWEAKLRPSLAYADAVVIEAGFAGGPVSPHDAEQGAIAAPAPQSPALIFYARLINMRKGDGLRVTVTGPGDFSAVSNTAPIDRTKAHFVAFAGKKRTAERWAAGRYQGQVEVLRGDGVIGRREAAFDLP
jgi:murein DD-endopeptidase MepM/ murein hydrolase activator NlpD